MYKDISLINLPPRRNPLSNTIVPELCLAVRSYEGVVSELLHVGQWLKTFSHPAPRISTILQYTPYTLHLAPYINHTPLHTTPGTLHGYLAPFKTAPPPPCIERCSSRILILAAKSFAAAGVVRQCL